MGTHCYITNGFWGAPIAVSLRSREATGGGFRREAPPNYTRRFSAMVMRLEAGMRDYVQENPGAFLQ